MLRQAATYMIAHAVSAILGLCSVIIFTRLLSPEEYGFYIVCMSISGFVSALLFAWVKVSVLRFESEGMDIRSTALAGLLLSMGAAPFIVLVAIFAIGENVLTTIVGVCLAMALATFEFGQEILRARQRSNVYGLSAVTRAVLALVLALLLVWGGFAGLGLVLGVTGAYLFTSLLFAGFVWQRPVHGFNSAVFRQMLTFGVPMAISGIVFSLHSAMDRLLIVYFLGEGAAGVYGASADLVRQIVLFPATAVAAAVIPVAIKAFADGGSVTAKQQMSRSGELLLAVLAPTVVGLALVSSHLSGIILGAEFREAATYLMPVLSFVWMFQVLTQQFVHVSFHMAKMPRLLAIQGSIVLVINAALMLALLPRYGLFGAAWALLLAEASGVAIGYALALKAQPLPLLAKPIVKVAAATIAMAVPTTFVLFRIDGMIGLSVAIVVGMIVYAIAAIILDIADVRKAITDRVRPMGEITDEA